VAFCLYSTIRHHPTEAETMRPLPLDSCEVTVLVDNMMDILSTTPAFVTGEVANVRKAGAAMQAGQCLCCAQWGLSLVIKARSGGGESTLLFDSGPEGYAVERNGDRLGIDFGAIDGAVFSHGHWDHVGGMTAALRLISKAKGHKNTPVFVNAGMFVSRGMANPDGSVFPHEPVPSIGELAAAGGQAVLSDGARLLLDGRFYQSGEIPRVSGYEQGLKGQKRLLPDGTWVPDELLMEERFVAVHLQDRGMLVFSACSHAGIVNVLRHAREVFAPVPIYGVMGGFHLSGAYPESITPQTVADMAEINPELIVPGHCTGYRAIHQLIETFGERRVVPCAVGRTYHFAGGPRG
jgi:7,8-dihydropterin-6-yl-methyl-4-(beta-D-ribofuranosyl)aminobenzene 5'-phosphate synthase